MLIVTSKLTLVKCRLLLKTPLRNKSTRGILFYLLKKHDVLKITHLISFSKVLLWFSWEREVGNHWYYELWVKIYWRRKNLSDQCVNLCDVTRLFLIESVLTWTLEVALTVCRIHRYCFYIVLLILVRVWSDKNCHDYRELLERLKQCITGPIYWRQKIRWMNVQLVRIFYSHTPCR